MKYVQIKNQMDRGEVQLFKTEIGIGFNSINVSQNVKKIDMEEKCSWFSYSVDWTFLWYKALKVGVAYVF